MYQKFIINQDGVLKFGHVYLHRELLGPGETCPYGGGIYKDHDEAFASLKKLAVIDPDEANRSAYLEAYSAWKEEMKKL